MCVDVDCSSVCGGGSSDGPTYRAGLDYRALAGFDEDGESNLILDPYPNGIDLQIWAAIKKPNLLARPSSQTSQQVAQVIITVSDFEP